MSCRQRSEQDLAMRIWAELAVIEQGSVEIVRHMRMLTERRPVEQSFDRAATGKHREQRQSIGAA